MLRIDLKVGFSCNNQCIFCIQGNKRSRVEDKSDEMVRKILKDRSSHESNVVFTGGEVTIRKEIFGWIRYAKELGYKDIQIQTNGRMFSYKDFCLKAIEAGANDFALAIHGSTKDIHDKLTRAPGSYDQTLQGIKNLVELGQKVNVNTVVTKMNYKDLPNVARLLVSIGVNQFQFAFMHINNSIKNNPKIIEELIPRMSVVNKYIKEGLQIGIDNNVMVMAEAIPYCFLEGYEDYVSDKYIPPSAVFDESFIEDFAKHRKELGKSKGPNCGSCKFFNICEGTWKEYPEIFGWDEFKPVK